MTTTSQIIEISVSKDTQPVSRASQNYPLILSAHTAFSERARVYTSLSSAAEDFDNTSTTYKMVQAIFSQPIVPSQVVVGRRQINKVTGTPVVANSTAYTVTINDTNYTYTSDATATAAEIVAGLDTAVGAPAGITFTDNLDGTFTVGPSDAGTAWSLSTTSNISLAQGSVAESWSDSIKAVKGVNNAWYVLFADSHNASDQEDIADIIETDRKIYVTSSNDSNAATVATTDIGYTLKALSYERTAVIWSEYADTQYPEIGWASRQLQDVPGSNDWCYKEITGVTPSSLSDNASYNLHNKNYTTYETLDGVNRTIGGDMVDGTPIDEVVFLDWVVINMRADLWQMFANVRKVPYTAAGFTMIESKIRAVNARGISNGGIASSPAPFVQMPVLALIPTTDKANRHVPGIVNNITLAGSIRTIAIRINVSL